MEGRKERRDGGREGERRRNERRKRRKKKEMLNQLQFVIEGLDELEIFVPCGIISEVLSNHITKPLTRNKLKLSFYHMHDCGLKILKIFVLCS